MNDDSLAIALASPALRDTDTWLWFVPLDVSISPSTIEATLSNGEMARAARFRFERDAHRYRVSHVALRQVLSGHTGIAARDLCFKEGAFGKPRFSHGAAPHFNMSHSGDWALIGVSATPLGVDIEVHVSMDDVDVLAQRNYTEAERASIRDSQDPTTAFLRCWTRKEACLKALGSGLSIEPYVFEAGAETALRETMIDGCRMRVVSISVPAQAHAACAWLETADRHLEL